MSSNDWRAEELMVAAAAREIRDGEVVFVGMRLPLLAFCVAKEIQAPRAVGLFENGVLRSTPSPDLLMTMSDPPNLMGADACTGMLTVMGFLQSGRVDLGFLGAGQVDRFGNLNSTEVRRPDGSPVRLPGSGGACDIASMAGRFVVLLRHGRDRLPAHVSYVTSPGYLDGWHARERAGLQRGGPSAVITTLGVLRFRPDSHEAWLASVHPGVEVEEVRRETGWDLDIPDDVPVPSPPTAAELEILRRYDPEGFWTGGKGRTHG